MTTRTARPSALRPLPPAPPITRPSQRNLQPEMAEFADDRRFADPVTPYRRGFEDCLYERVFANPYAFDTEAAAEYARGNGDARLAQYQQRTHLRVDETAELDVLLAQRGMTAQIERFDLRTGTVVQSFSIGRKDVER